METHAQRSIRHCLAMLAPFEMPKQYENDGLLQFYQFMTAIYEEMYQDPEKYLVFPKPYEAYLANSSLLNTQKKKEKEHVSNSRESTLRNTFQQAIQFYALYFYHIGLQCKDKDGPSDCIILSKEAYLHVTSQMSRIHDAKHNADRYALLADLGMSKQPESLFRQ